MVCHYFVGLYLTKWKIVAPNEKSMQELVKLLYLPTVFKISEDDMSMFSWSLFNRTKKLTPNFFYRVSNNMGGGGPPPPQHFKDLVLR